MNSTAPNAAHLLRVVVVGSSCSGKSTMARELAAIMGAKHVELDDLYWGPSWTPKPEAAFLALAAAATSSGSWVVAGNYALARPVIWPRATTIVWLNYGYLRMLWRALARSVRRLAKREALFHGNRE